MAKLPNINEWANSAAKEGIETIKNILSDQYNLTIEKVAELAKAEADGLIIKLAMTDRAKIFIPVYKENKVFETHIEHRNIQIKKGKLSYAVCVSDSMGMIMYFADDDIGKTVFLTLTEAKQALKDMEGTK